MKCIRCCGSNGPESKYCEHCGIKLTNVCPKCGTTGISGKTFCPHCGAHLKMLFLTLGLEENLNINSLKDLDIEAELEVYKREISKGAIIVTCPNCSVKNRIPKDRMRQRARCGSCGEFLPS